MAGQPTKYNKEVQTKADAYLFDFDSIDGSVIPSIEGLSEYLSVARSTIYLWKDAHPQFSDTLGAIEAKQKSLTLNNGLKGEFNATIAKLVLANHGMHDKTDSTVGGVDGKPVKVEWILEGVSPSEEAKGSSSE